MKIYTDKSSYQGLWKNNSREGKGVFIDKDGQKFIGFFVNDKFFSLDNMSPNTQSQFSNKNILKDQNEPGTETSFNPRQKISTVSPIDQNLNDYEDQNQINIPK